MKTKKELDNRELTNKIEKSRSNIKRKIEKFIGDLEKEISKVSHIKEKYELNEFNTKLFDKKSAKFVILKNGMLQLWAKTLRKL